MEYKRLTERTRKSICVKETSTNDNKSIWNALERLAELEDKIENGTLVELPCKVGDTVYYETFINSKSQGIKQHKVIGFVLEVMTQNIGGFGCTAVPIKDFGETVFLTKAEAKLKELENEI